MDEFFPSMSFYSSWNYEATPRSTSMLVSCRVDVHQAKKAVAVHEWREVLVRRRDG